MNGFFCFICSKMGGGSWMVERIASLRAVFIFCSASFFLNDWFMRDVERDSFIASTDSKATLFSNNVNSSSMKNSSNCSWVSFEAVIRVMRREKNDGFCSSSGCFGSSVCSGVSLMVSSFGVI